MSKKEEEEDEEQEEQTATMLLLGKIGDGKKKSWQRRRWLEKRRKRKSSTRRRRRRTPSNIIDQSQKHRNVGGGGRNRQTVRRVPSSILPPLCWSSASLICHLPSKHDSTRNCLESSWTWSKSAHTDDGTAVLLDQQKQILFHPRTSSSTQVILADRPLPSHGKHYWEIYMPSIYGTSIMFGIASKF